MPLAHVGGRPRQIEATDIVRVGRDLGMRDLSLSAVAAALGVSTTALYRHVDGRWGLERLVGESLLADLHLVDDPDHDTPRHLVSFGLQLHGFAVRHPGLAAYLQTLFPRGSGGEQLLRDEVAALRRRGYTADTALVLCGAVASLSIGLAAAADAQREHAEGLGEQQQQVLTRLLGHAELGDPHRALPEVVHTDYVRLVLTAAIRGLVDAAPPGRPVPAIVAALSADGEDN